MPTCSTERHVRSDTAGAGVCGRTARPAHAGRCGWGGPEIPYAPRWTVRLRLRRAASAGRRGHDPEDFDEGTRVSRADQTAAQERTARTRFDASHKTPATPRGQGENRRRSGVLSALLAQPVRQAPLRRPRTCEPDHVPGGPIRPSPAGHGGPLRLGDQHRAQQRSRRPRTGKSQPARSNTNTGAMSCPGNWQGSAQSRYRSSLPPGNVDAHPRP